MSGCTEPAKVPLTLKCSGASFMAQHHSLIKDQLPRQDGIYIRCSHEQALAVREAVMYVGDQFPIVPDSRVPASLVAYVDALTHDVLALATDLASTPMEMIQ
jgi:hypothetical protein